MAHVMISAAHKSSGKTSVSAGIAAALRWRDLKVQPFKKGPDYIDPSWLGRAAGRPCHNLDFNTQSAPEILALFARHGADANLSLIEGNKGLYDGVDPAGSDSNAALAGLLGAPVVLVIDTRGMTRGIAPLLRGYRDFDEGVSIVGVILNPVGGPRHEAKLRAAVERYTELPVLGALWRDPALELGERHLGLVPSGEDPEAEAKIARLADAVSAGVDLDRLRALAAAANAPMAAPALSAPAPVPDLRIAIARDAAFTFYYPGDLEAFAAAGARLIPFDTLSDSRLPEADGLFIGGGFPECALGPLSANRSLRASTATALAAGMPAYAECGGLLYLARSLSWRGETREMVGVIPADAVLHQRPQGRGYMRVEETGAGLWPLTAEGAGEGAGEGEDEGDGPARFAAHEFHYAALENLPPDPIYAYRVLRGSGLDGAHDGLVIGNLTASFMHLRDTTSNHWVARFVAFVRARKRAPGGQATPRPPGRGSCLGSE